MYTLLIFVELLTQYFPFQKKSAMYAEDIKSLTLNSNVASCSKRMKKPKMSYVALCKTC